MKQRTMKRMILLALLCCLLVSLAVTASAEDLSGSCGKGVNWYYDDETTTLTISGKGEMMDQADYRRPVWEKVTHKVTAIVIEEGITRVGDNSFWNMGKLTSVSLPSTLKSIGSFAISYATKLPALDLPDSVEVIGNYAFCHNEALTEIELPNQLKSIGIHAFDNCISLKTVLMHEGLQSIGDYAFYQCKSLLDASMPNTVTEMGHSVFMSCSNLVSAHLSEGLTKTDRTFSGCKSLFRVNIPKGLKNLGDFTFYECKSLTGVVLPEGLEKLGECALARTGLKQLIVPESVTYIGDQAFGYNGGKIAILNPECTIKKSDWSPTLGQAGKMTVYCYEGSTAEESALATGLAIVYITEDNLWTDTMPIINPFEDVKEDSWFKDYVLWAVDNDITTGTTATTFSPNSDCTRKQVVTFLWRAAGEPVPNSMDNPFTDVKETDYFYTAVLWAVEEGITNGMEVDKFGPNQPCTRGQVVTFLYRYSGEPQIQEESNPFSDVGKSYYLTPVLWAVENNITTGMSAGLFAPGETCTRAQIVTFLYRCETGNR